MVIGISGASGKLGRLAVQAALHEYATETIVATTRTPESLRELENRGVSVRLADFDRPETLKPAFDGIDRLFMISASNGTGRRFDEHQSAIEAARAVGVSRLVFPSMPRVDDPAHPVGLAAQEYREAEELVKSSGIPYVILRDAPYTELHVIDRFLPVMASRELRINAGTGRAPFISRTDVAIAAIACLVREPILDRTYDLSGEQLLSYVDLARTISDVTGVELRVTELSDEELYDEVLAGGVPQLLADALRGMGRAVRTGYFGVLTDDFQLLTGARPRTVREVVVQYLDVLIGAGHARRPMFYAN